MKTIRILALWLVTIAVWLVSPAHSGAAPFVEVNLARTGTATQSSDLGGGVPERAIDGNTDGSWPNNSVTHTTNTDDPAWWEVDLGGVKQIGAVSVWFRTDCCNNRDDDFTLSVLDASRAEVFKQQYPGRPPRNAVYNFAPPIAGQYVRIEAQNPRTTSDGYLSLAEVEVIAPYQNASINITQNPTDVTISENQAATFGPVAATVVDGPQERMTIQWQKNGVDIPGATSATYTTAPQTLADNGAEYSVKFLLQGVPTLSTKAKLNVTNDVAAPLVDSLGFAGGANLLLSVNYNELADPSTSTNTANYTLAGGANIISATLKSPTLNTNNKVFSTVTLEVAGLAPNTNYSLTISGVKDVAGNTIVTTNLSGTVPFYEINYARSGTATQSSDIDALQLAHLALDGNTDGQWRVNNLTHTMNTDDPPWWEVDLGSMKAIGRVSVWFRTDCCLNRNDDFTLIILDASRAEVSRQQYAGRPPRNASYNFASPVQGQYVRIEGQTPRTTSDGYLSLAEVEVIAPYQNAALNITQGPADVSVLENRSATFGPLTSEAVGAPQDKVTYQWQKNGVDIPGANGASYTTPPLALTETGAEYSAKALLSGLSVVSAKAKVTVTKDVDPPKVDFVDSVASAGTAKFLVTYDDLIDPVTSIVAGNYVFQAGVTVTEATLGPDGKTVTLSLDGLSSSTGYSLTINGVKDLGGNTIASTALNGTLQINYALAGQASQSSDEGAGTAERAIDGNTDGNWANNSVTHTGNADNPPVWELDLGAPKQIGQVHLWFRTDCCVNRNDDITVFILGANRAEVLKLKYPGRPPSHIAFNVAPAAQGQFVRVEGQTPRTTSDGYLALAEVQVFNPYETETLTITQGPTNQTAAENSTATFGPVTTAVVGAPPSKLTFQWQKNGVDIPGAYSASYTTPPLTSADNGAEYAVKVLLPGVSATAKATLTVTPGPSAGPALDIERVGITIRIAWPVSATGFVLESTDSFTSPNWTQTTEQVVVSGEENSITISNPTGTKFYRLIKR